MENLGMDSLVGLTVSNATINPENDLVILETDKGNYYLSWVGDCCAHCFLAGISGSDALKDATILSVESAEWKTIQKQNDDWDGQIEIMGTNIRTNKGHISFESRVTHSGYYGGNIMVSKDEPINQYHSLRFEEDDEYPEMKPLKDF